MSTKRFRNRDRRKKTAKHKRPAQADEEPVPARHIGDRQPLTRRIGIRVSARFPGEDEVDGVLRENGDHGDYRERQPLAHVHLGRLGRPAQEKRRAEDRNAEHCRADDRIGVRSAGRITTPGMPSATIAPRITHMTVRSRRPQSYVPLVRS